jgi:hypothetical protein
MLKPYYIIDFSASACLFEIRVNDYPVIQMNIEGQVSSMIPINYAILKTGKQIISATILPFIGSTELHSKSELKFNIKLFDVSNDFVFNKQFCDYQSEPIQKKGIPIIKCINTFLAEVPYKLSAWQNGENLKNIKKCREKLELAYNNIAKIIQNKQYDIFKKFISKREKNMATSMYLSEEEKQNRVKGLLSDFNSGFKVQPIPKECVMFLYADNRVAMLKKLNGESALYLKNKETEEELMLDISFYIPKGKEEFEII